MGFTIYYPISDYLNFLKANKKENFCPLWHKRRKSALNAANFLIEKGFVNVAVWQTLPNGRERLIYHSVQRTRN